MDRRVSSNSPRPFLLPPAPQYLFDNAATGRHEGGHTHQIQDPMLLNENTGNLPNRPPQFAPRSANISNPHNRPPQFAQRSASMSNPHMQPPQFAPRSANISNPHNRPPQFAPRSANISNPHNRPPQFAPRSQNMSNPHMHPPLLLQSSVKESYQQQDDAEKRQEYTPQGRDMDERVKSASRQPQVGSYRMMDTTEVPVPSQQHHQHQKQRSSSVDRRSFAKDRTPNSFEPRRPPPSSSTSSNLQVQQTRPTAFHSSHSASNLTDREGATANAVQTHVVPKKTTVATPETLIQNALKLVEAHDVKIKQAEGQNVPNLKIIQNKELLKKIQFMSDIKETQITELQRQRAEFEDALNTYSDKLADNSIKQMFERECARFEAALPIYAKKSAIIDTLASAQVCIVAGPSGCGKSTQLVQYVYDAACFGNKQLSRRGQIVCTQPRRAAAILLARYVAQQYGSQVGDVVGYRVGGEIKERGNTSIKFATDRILLNEYTADATLSKYSCIIVDEAHERTLLTDLLLGLLKRLLPQRPELRVVIMSATIDNIDVIQKFFNNCPFIIVPRRPNCVIGLNYQEKPIDDQPENLYVATAVEQAWQQIQSNQSGGILVFLASPADVDIACDKLNSYPNANQRVHCLPLHSGIPISEQEKVFEPAPPGKCKVVFATKIAESSIIIPDITCIIDSGRVREQQYDAKMNLNRLQQHMISQNSAEQRMDLAGRSAQGVCYRLYTEKQFAAMKASSQPAILCMNLGLIILKLLEMEIANPHSFDFVQSPPREALDNAVATLTELGAVEQNKLTDLGKKITKLELEPRYAKFLLRAIKEGVGYDALCTVAMSSVAGSIFFRNNKGNEEDRLSAEKHKVQLCHKMGDSLTNIHIFQAWLENSTEKQKCQWCMTNGINFKSMLSAREALNEINTNLNNDLNISVQHTFCRQEVRESVLPHLILECFSSNLARFTGHKDRGYYVLNKSEVLALHPSSSLYLLGGTLPTWVVFEQEISAGRYYILNVTEVAENKVIDLNQKGLVKCDIRELASRAISPFEVESNLGNTVVRNLIGRGQSDKRILEENIEQIINKKLGNNSYCVLEFSEGKLMAFCTQSALPIVRTAISGRLRVVREDINNLALEKPLVVGKPIQVQLQAGLTVKQLMKAEEFVRIVIVKIPENMPEEDFKGQLTQFGQYTISRYNTSNTWGAIKFENSSCAKRAASWCKEHNISIKDSTSNRQKKDEFRIVITWLRRPNKGFAFVSFDSPTSAKDCLQQLPLASQKPKLVVKGKQVDVALDRSNDKQLYLTNLDQATTRDDVEEACDELLPTANVASVKMQFKYTLPPPSDWDTSICQDIETAVSRALAQQSLRCFVSEPVVNPLSETTVRGRAIVSFSDLSCAMAVATAINNRLLIENELVQAHLEPSMIFIREPVYRVIKQDLITFLSQQKATLLAQGITISKHCTKVNNMQINISGRHPNDTVKYRAVIVKIASPRICQTKNLEFVQLLKSESGESFLKSLRKQYNAYAELDKLLWTVNIYGSKSSKDEAMRRLKQYMEASSQAETREINLQSANKPRGLMKDLLNHYGCSVEKIRVEIGALYCSLDIRKQTLTVRGSADSLKKLEQILNARSAQLAPSATSLFSASRSSAPSFCPICLTDIQADKVHYLEICGHAYCQECLRFALQNAVNNKELPITCCYDKCGRPLAIDDIRQLVSDNDAEWQELVAASMESYVRLSAGKFHNCFTPNCPMVYEQTAEGTRLICELCEAEICTKCKVEYHQGFSCDIFQRLRSNPDSGVTMWLDQDRANRKLCPSCSAPIEKDGGCNHMTCSSCRIHICWICSQTFATGNDTYTHIGLRHAGQLFT